MLQLDLRRRIQSQFLIELTLIDMFNASTLASMALTIESNDKRQPSAKHINWDQETDLSSVLRQSLTTQPVKHFGSKIVVLTGSTGYLAQGILDAIVEDPDVEKIHCIAVRNVSGRQDMLNLKKVALYEGDLAYPRLGLSDCDVQGIFGTANVIIQNGADVSYMKTYSTLRLPNLQATNQLAEMSINQMISFHYISSGGACSFAAASGSRSIGPSSVARFSPPTDGKLGYASSKWASEVILEKLKGQHAGWLIWVHRPSNIARIDTPQLDLVYNLQQYSCLLQAVPVARGKAHGTLDSVTLDTVEQGVLDSVNETSQKQNDRKVRFLHHLGHVDLLMDNLRSWIVDKDSVPTGSARRANLQAEIEEIPFDQWNARAAEQGMHPALVAFLQMFAAQGGLTFPRLVHNSGVA